MLRKCVEDNSVEVILASCSNSSGSKLAPCRKSSLACSESHKVCRNLTSLVKLTFFLLISFLYFYATIFWHGNTRYYLPCLIYISFLFGIGLHYILSMIIKNYNFEKFNKQWVDLMTETHEKYGSWENRKMYNRWELIKMGNK